MTLPLRFWPLFWEPQAGGEGAIRSRPAGRDGICWDQVSPSSGFLGRLALAQGYAGLPATDQQFTGTLTIFAADGGKGGKVQLGDRTQQVGDACSL